MTTSRNSLVTKSLAIVVALVATVALSGCFANPLGDKISEGVAKNGAEKLIEGATGGDVDVEVDGELPRDFPSEVPTIDGKIRTSMKTKIDDDIMWSVTYAVDDPETKMKEARDKLLSAGFEEGFWNEGAVAGGSFNKGDLVVILGAMIDSDSDEATNLTFGVTKHAQKE